MSEAVKRRRRYAICSDAVGVRNSQGKRDIKKASLSGWPFSFSVPPRRLMVAYVIWIGSTSYSELPRPLSIASTYSREHTAFR